MNTYDPGNNEYLQKKNRMPFENLIGFAIVFAISNQIFENLVRNNVAGAMN